MVSLWITMIINALILFFVLAIPLGLIALGIWFVLSGRKRLAGPAGESPLDVLKTRYARGEISTEQYEDMKRRLGDA